jgi:hypothetical protein
MLLRVCFSLALLAAPPLWSQATPDEESRMLTPPPVSSEAYPTMVGSEMRSNYLTTGLIFNTAYDDNVLGEAAATPVRDVTYSIWPTIRLNLTTPRQLRTITYSPGFTFYQHTTALNAADQNATFNFQYRLSQHTTISLNDSFQKSSNVFSQPNSLSGIPISGSSQSSPTGVLAPYADRLSNTANVGLSYQFSENGMMGFGGIDTQSNYPNPAEASGLYDSNSLGGSAFYSQRLSSTQYVGLTYQYLNSHSDPANAQANPASSSIEVQTQTLLPFYTIYFNPTLSVSLSGGPQHVDAMQSLSPSFRAWKPSAMASIGWQSRSTNLVASYSRTVTGGVGLPGAFDSNSANATVRWQITRTWIVESGASYAINKNITPLFSPYSPGGHTVSGTVSLEYSISDHFKTDLGYVRLHQSYSGVTVISNAPDSNRVFVSVSFQFNRALGR